MAHIRLSRLSDRKIFEDMVCTLWIPPFSRHKHGTILKHEPGQGNRHRMGCEVLATIVWSLACS